MIVDFPKAKTAYCYVQGAVKPIPRDPVCSFCGAKSVYFAEVQLRPYSFKNVRWWACVVCKESLREVAVKSHISPPTWAPGVEELWYTMPKEKVLSHPLYLKWKGC